MHTLQDLLMLVSKSGGQLDNRIRIQKSAFLLGWANISTFSNLRFHYHHYGPYSRELSYALQTAVSSGFLTETEVEESHGTRYSYSITQPGKDLVKGSDSPASAFQKAALLLKDVHWRALELAATALFLRTDERLSPEKAMIRALELKPACKDFLGEANQVILDISSIQQST